MGIDVAIKLYISLDQKGQDEFKDEYKVAYGLSHENLLTSQYYGVWEHRPFLIMKYCARGSAGNLGGNVSEEEIWKFIHDVANGLKYLHAQEPPIVHQDIKPENILIDEQGNFLITDFGISKKMRTTMRKQSKRAIESGAIAYMGPERFLKDPMAVKASDIWSLGVSIYELATNDLPFMGQGGGMLNAGAALPELDEEYSRNLNEVMQLCLAKDTWDRPTAEELADYTQQVVLKGRNISYSHWKKQTDTEPPLSNPEPQKSHSTKLVIPAIIGAIVIALCVYMLGGFHIQEDERSIEMRYNGLKSMCENNIKIGDAPNYQALLEAKALIDSLKAYQSEYQFLKNNLANSYSGLETSLSGKIDDAQAAWIRSAEGQLNVAEDVSTAIIYYHIASLLKSSSAINNAISNIARSSGCNGAYMAVTKMKVDNGKLIIDYNGLNSSTINGVTIQYEIGDLREQATISIISGNNQRVTISLNGTPSSQNLVRLSNNGIIFYDSTIME